MNDEIASKIVFELERNTPLAPIGTLGAPGSDCDRQHIMDRDKLRHLFSENIEKWVRVRYEDGSVHFAYIINVDQKGYVHKLNDDDDQLFWTTFDDVESASPADESGEIAESGLSEPT